MTKKNFDNFEVIEGDNTPDGLKKLKVLKIKETDIVLRIEVPHISKTNIARVARARPYGNNIKLKVDSDTLRHVKSWFMSAGIRACQDLNLEKPETLTKPPLLNFVLDQPVRGGDHIWIIIREFIIGFMVALESDSRYTKLPKTSVTDSEGNIFRIPCKKEDVIELLKAADLKYIRHSYSAYPR